jgi:hypothetical protein
MTDGDVDMQANPAGLPIASTSHSSTLNLGDHELDSLTQLMNMYSKDWDWSSQMKSTTVHWERFLMKILRLLLHSHTMDKFLSMISWEEAEEKINNFNEEQLNKWREATRRGVEMGDWTDLFSFGMCLSGCLLVCLCLSKVQ